MMWLLLQQLLLLTV